MQGFKAFLLRGNVIDLAVAVVIGSAFFAVVGAFTTAFITPLVALILGKHDIVRGLSFTVNGILFPVYAFVNGVFAFIVTAAVIYFLVVLPVNALIARSRKEPPADPTTKKCT